VGVRLDSRLDEANAVRAGRPSRTTGPPLAYAS
jgi:hypothetical protein